MLEEISKSIHITVGKDGITTVIAGDDWEEEYRSERRCFLKDVRNRTQKADRETLEKMKFKEKYEQYHLRTPMKKRNPYDVELDEFIRRPIIMGRKKWTLTKETHVCGLCSPVLDPTSIVQSPPDSRKIVASPYFSSFSSNFRQTVDESDSFLKVDMEIFNGAKRNRRLLLNYKHKIDFLRLTEAKNTLLFIQKYNIGLIVDKKN
jgi:hypothetical protein